MILIASIVALFVDDTILVLCVPVWNVTCQLMRAIVASITVVVDVGSRSVKHLLNPHSHASSRVRVLDHSVHDSITAPICALVLVLLIRVLERVRAVGKRPTILGAPQAQVRRVHFWITVRSVIRGVRIVRGAENPR